MQARHQLRLPPTVTGAELFDLINQVFPTSPVQPPAGDAPTPIAPGTEVFGPDSVPDGTVWRVVTQRVRHEPPEVTDPEGLYRAFPDGLPDEPEGRVVRALLGLAARLGGTVTCDVGERDVTMTPARWPAVSLTVWSDVHLTPAVLLGVVRRVLPAAHPPGFDTTFTGATPERDADVELSEEEFAALHAKAWREDAAALGSTEVDEERFAVVAELAADDPDPDVVTVEAHPADGERAPRGRSLPYCFDVHWFPADDAPLHTDDPDPGFLAARAAAARVVAAVALAITEAVQGVVSDDGFLVDRYELSGP